jgi:hypothetical protein
MNRNLYATLLHEQRDCDYCGNTIFQGELAVFTEHGSILCSETCLSHFKFEFEAQEQADKEFEARK